MDPIVFTPKEVPTLRRAVQFLRRREQVMPHTAHEKTREGLLLGALCLDDQADTVGWRASESTANADRPEALRAPAEAGMLRIQGAMLALHPKLASPRHGCCAPPKLCKGHVAECRSSEHNLSCPGWPCKSLRVVGITSHADAQAVRQALAGLERLAGPHGYPSRKKTNRGRTVHATRQCDDGIGDAGACGMYFPQDMEGTLEDPGTEVTCQACVKALARKEASGATLAGPEGCSRNEIDGDLGSHFFKAGALADSPVACIYCGTPKPDTTGE